MFWTALLAACVAQSDTTAPAAVTDLAVTGVSSTTVSLSWTAPGDDGAVGTATAYDIRYSTAGPIDESAWGAAVPVMGEPPPAAAGTSQSMTVTGLSGGVTYYFALKTRDEVPNWSAISNSPSGVTDPPSDSVPPGAVTDLAVAGSAPDEVTLSWTAPGDDDFAGTAAAYDLRLAGTPIVTDADFDVATPVGGLPVPAPVGVVQYTVVPLGGMSVYYLALKTRDEANNWSALSNVVTNVPLAVADSGHHHDKQGIPHRCGSVGADLLLLPLGLWLLRRRRRGR